ncbi:MAG: hypothetical protein HY791_01245 [Deltaproteobacteria bacterium]|nr:hypothetical protein [Deltaproteobacteria bacterium]
MPAHSRPRIWPPEPQTIIGASFDEFAVIVNDEAGTIVEAFPGTHVALASVVTAADFRDGRIYVGGW